MSISYLVLLTWRSTNQTPKNRSHGWTFSCNLGMSIYLTDSSQRSMKEFSVEFCARRPDASHGHFSCLDLRIGWETCRRGVRNDCQLLDFTRNDQRVLAFVLCSTLWISSWACFPQGSSTVIMYFWHSNYQRYESLWTLFPFHPLIAVENVDLTRWMSSWLMVDNAHTWRYVPQVFSSLCSKLVRTEV